MSESYADILSVGGKSNSLGRAAEVIESVLRDKSRFSELYSCTLHEDAWVRMRAIDAIEKIGREKPDWLVPYIDKFQAELASSTQPSILWHLAQIYRQIQLTTVQKQNAIDWLKRLLSTPEIDWIVSADCMKTLAQFAGDGSVSRHDAKTLIQVQLNHRSKAVVRAATKLLAEF